MNSFFSAALILLFSATSSKSNKTTLKTLVDYMQGSYSSEAQSVADTNYLHITLEMHQIWKSRNDGAWLYVEQTAAWTPGKPYRQRIYHLEQITDCTFKSTVLTMPHPENYVGCFNDEAMLETLSVDSLTVLEGCALHLVYRDEAFIGATEVGTCLNSWGDATFATSEVAIYPDSLYSWDRGYNDKKVQVWGAEKAGYQFIKQKK